MLSQIYSLGQVLYSYYALAFLMAGIILLVAMIGAIVLTMQIRTTYVANIFFNKCRVMQIMQYI